MKETRGLSFKWLNGCQWKLPPCPPFHGPANPSGLTVRRCLWLLITAHSCVGALPVPKLHLPVLVGISVSPATSPAWLKIFYRNTVLSFDYQTTKQGTPWSWNFPPIISCWKERKSRAWANHRGSCSMNEAYHFLDHNDGPLRTGQHSDLDCLDMHNSCPLFKPVVFNLHHAVTLSDSSLYCSDPHHKNYFHCFFISVIMLLLWLVI